MVDTRSGRRSAPTTKTPKTARQKKKQHTQSKVSPHLVKTICLPMRIEFLGTKDRREDEATQRSGNGTTNQADFRGQASAAANRKDNIVHEHERPTKRHGDEEVPPPQMKRPKDSASSNHKTICKGCTPTSSNHEKYRQEKVEDDNKHGRTSSPGSLPRDVSAKAQSTTTTVKKSPGRAYMSVTFQSPDWRPASIGYSTPIGKISSSNMPAFKSARGRKNTPHPKVAKQGIARGTTLREKSSTNGTKSDLKPSIASCSKRDAGLKPRDATAAKPQAAATSPSHSLGTSKPGSSAAKSSSSNAPKAGGIAKSSTNGAVGPGFSATPDHSIKQSVSAKRSATKSDSAGHPTNDAQSNASDVKTPTGRPEKVIATPRPTIPATPRPTPCNTPSLNPQSTPFMSPSFASFYSQTTDEQQALLSFKIDRLQETIDNRQQRLQAKKLRQKELENELEMVRGDINKLHSEQQQDRGRRATYQQKLNNLDRDTAAAATPVPSANNKRKSYDGRAAGAMTSAKKSHLAANHK